MRVEKARGDGLLTPDDYGVLAGASDGRIQLPEVDALVAFGGDDTNDPTELRKSCELLMHLLEGSLCAHALTHMMRTLDSEYAEFKASGAAAAAGAGGTACT